MSNLLNKIGDTVLSTKLDFLYGFLSNMDDAGIRELANLIKTQIGIDISNPDVLATLDDQTIEQLRKCAFDNFSTISEFYVQYKKIVTEDTKHARETYMKLIESNKDNKFFKYFPPLFGLIITVLVFGYVFMITFYEIPEKSIRFADTAIGFLLGILSAIVGFFFGSSDTTSSLRNTNKSTRPNGSTNNPISGTPSSSTSHQVLSEDGEHLPRE